MYYLSKFYELLDTVILVVKVLSSLIRKYRLIWYA